MDFTNLRLAVLLTCHNRKNSTLRCLAELYAQSYKPATLDVFLVDDGSTDGTAEEVKKRFPEVNIIEGNGTLFWNRGMHLAFSRSMEQGYDFYLWLNDDTYLYPDALHILFNSYTLQAATNKRCIIVGSTLDPETRKVSYGGYKINHPWHPFKYSLIKPQQGVMYSCDTMCGNCVLIPKEVVALVGNINPVYQHRWGDVDYGLRARQAGCKLLVAADYIGDCGFNLNSNVWENTSLSLRQRLKALNSIKGLQKRDWKYYTKKHGGTLWFLYWLSPYIKIYLSSLSLKTKKYAA